MTDLKNFSFGTAKRGDIVTEEVYDTFLNVAIPRNIKGGCGYCAGYQMGGSGYQDRLDTRTGTLRPMFATFGITPTGEHVYLGINFAYEVNSDAFAQLAPYQWPDVEETPF